MSTVQPQSAALKSAIRWVSDMTREHPEKKRRDLVREAEIRFDLTPADCLFLEKNFTAEGAGPGGQA